MRTVFSFATLRQRLSAFVLLAVLCLPVASWAQEGYFSALPELPLPPLMQENADSAVRFDQPEGRIITLQASGPAKPDEIIDFYHKTLPALGWVRHEVGAQETDAEKAYYSRNQEVLFIEIKDLKKGSSRLNVLLRPL